MRAIGLRASPRAIWFAVVECVGDHDELLVQQEIPVPEALNEPERLRFVRQTVSDTITEYGATRAGLRLAEPVAKTVPWARMHLEGVLQELIASSPVEMYFHGPIAQVARFLGVTDRKDVKSFLEGTGFRGIRGWGDMKLEARESVIWAIAALGMPG